MAFVNTQRQNVFVASSASEGEASGSFTAGGMVELALSFENSLAPGRYSVSTLITRRDGSIVMNFDPSVRMKYGSARANKYAITI